MGTTIEELEQYITVPRETPGLEFKEAKVQYDNTKLFRYCVAIANEGGGKLLLGVTDELPRRVVGTQAINDPPAMEKRILDKIHFRVAIEAVEHPDGRVVICHIPSRPFGTAYTYEGAYLMRSDEHLVAMTEDRLRQIFDEGKPSWLEEHSRTGLSDQEVVDLLDTQTFFELLGIPYPSEREGVIARLVSERLVDRIDGAFCIRRLGALLLAKELGRFSRAKTEGSTCGRLQWDIKDRDQAGRNGQKGLCGRLSAFGEIHYESIAAERSNCGCFA